MVSKKTTPKVRSKRISIYLNEMLYDFLIRKAEKHGITLTQAIRDIILVTYLRELHGGDKR